MQLSVKPKADLSHNPFDTASRDVFSLKTGMITPCLVRHTIPDSMYDCSLMGITRTIPVQSAPFTRMSQNFEYYFVPYSQIFHDFERIYYERGDEQRNFSGHGDSGFSHATQLPCFDLKDVVFAIFASYCYSRLKIEMRLSERRVHFDYYGAIEHKYIDEFQDVHGRSCAEDMLRLLDLLGYGNFLPQFKLIYSLIFKRFEVDGAPSGAPNTWFSAWRLGDFDNFVAPTSSDGGTVEGLVNSMLSQVEFVNWMDNFPMFKPNVFALAAYVKVWSDFYRNSQYDVNFNYSKLFNFDYVVDDSLIVVPTSIVCQMLIPRYRQYKKDMFTGGYPSAQFGSVAVSQLENPSSIFSEVLNSGSAGYRDVLVTNPNTGQLGHGTSNSITSLSSSFIPSSFTIDSSVSALSIRQSLAMQRYKERILRAGNRTRSLQSAVFGDKSRYVEDMYVDFLGSEQSIIDFNPVAATASNERSELGELGSNGVSSIKNHVFKYHSHDFGIIIGVTYVLPESEYEAYMMDYFNSTSESFDFYKPDFMNLGLQEVYSTHFNFMVPFDFSMVGGYSPVVLNYLSRYWPYKVAIDKVHGEFYSNQPSETDLRTLYNASETYIASLDDLQDVLSSLSVGAFAEMVTPRKSNSLNVLVLPSFYVNPTDVDRIFYQISDTTQASDQFKCAILHDFKSVLPMSVVGLPSL